VLAASDEAVTAYARDMVLAVRAGARGCLYKQADPIVLGAAIRTVAAGGAAVPPLLAHALLLAFSRTRSAAALTPPERQVLHLLGEGMTEGDTAHRLAITERAVGLYLCRALDELAADGGSPPEVLGAGVPRRPSPPMLDASAAVMPDAEPSGA